MITDKSRYGHDAVLDVNCGDSVQVLRTEPMTLTEQEQKIVQKYLGIALLEKSYIDANGHLMVVLSDGRTLDVGSARGLPGATPYLGENGNWFVEGMDTLQSARGLPGFTPYIGENEHWWIDETDTGIPARGIPLTEKADNTRFLRNDGTWQKVTPENIGAAKQSDFAAQKSIVTDHTTRIEALEQRTVTAPYYTDDSVAYIKGVPENALPFASVDMVGGMTRKCTNLIRGTAVSTTRDGVTFTVNSDGSVALNGTATRDIYYDIGESEAASGEYTLSCPNAIAWASCILFCDQVPGWTSNPAQSVRTLDGGLYSFKLFCAAGYKYNNVIIRSALNEGNTALPYEPYFDGLRSAPVTEVKSMSANLWSGEILAQSAPTTYTFDAGTMTLTRNGGGIQAFVWGKEKYKAGTYNLSFDLSGTDAGANFRILKTKTPSATNIGVDIRSLYSNGTHIIAFTLTEDGYIGFGTDADNVKLTASNIMLNRGSTALPYTPYREPVSLPIPAEVQALDGYGRGINDKVYNYIYLENKRFAKRVGRVDMGTISWTNYGDEANTFRWVDPPAVLTDGATPSTLLCDRYVSVSYFDRKKGGICGFYTSYGREILIKDTSYTDAATFKAAMSGVMLYYELAEPVIIDISDLLTDDNLIRVEGGGTVTMVNEYGYDVPSEITYARLTWQ